MLILLDLLLEAWTACHSFIISHG